MADSAFPVLLDNLPVQQFSHLGRRPEFTVSSWVVRILDALHTHPHDSRFVFFSY
jgi:hypothetical protein